MRFRLCDRRTEQEWVDERPRNGTVVGEPRGDRGQVSGHRQLQQEVVGGQRESMPPGDGNGRVHAGFILSLYGQGVCSTKLLLPRTSSRPQPTKTAMRRDSSVPKSVFAWNKCRSAIYF